jgi:DNA-binding transcriptional MocR family regulator
VVCNGLQHGVSLVLSTFAKPGDVLLTEELNFPGFRLLEYAHPIEVRGIAIDGEGLQPVSLDDACRKSDASFLLYTPFVHSPTNAVASVDRRKQIAEVAERHNLMIIECDNNEIPPTHPMRPISELVPSRSIYVSTAWRATGFGICVGYIHAPKEFISKLTSALQATTWMLSPLQLEIFRQWMDTGTVQRILGWHRQENARRLKIAQSLLKGHEWRAHEASPHIWLPLPEPWRYEDFTRHAAQEGVLVLSADEFAIGRSPVPHAIRISLGGVRDINLLESALKKLGRILSGQPPLRRAVV